MQRYGKRSDAHRTRRGGGRLCNAMALLFIYARPLESGNWAEGAHSGKPTSEKSAPCVIYLQPAGVSRCINQQSIAGGRACCINSWRMSGESTEKRLERSGCCINSWRTSGESTEQLLDRRRCAHNVAGEVEGVEPVAVEVACAVWAALSAVCRRRHSDPGIGLWVTSAVPGVD